MKKIYNILKNRIITSRDSIKTVISILTNFATIVSALLVLFTLWEMQKQRNNAYMPDIIFDTVTVNLQWGNTKNLDKPLADTDVEYNPSSILIPTRNIGVGVAKQITYSIDSSTLIELLNLLNELDTNNKYTYTQKENQFIICKDGTEIIFPTEYETKKAYLLPNAEEVYDFILPMQYAKTLQEIYYLRNSALIDIPDIKINVVFKDVQGVEYNNLITLTIEDYFYTTDTEGNGLATYKISMK